MPGCPLRRTSTRPSDGADQNQKPKQSKNEAACQPTWLFDGTHSPVASLLAMDVNDNACCLNERGVPTFFASKLAPTGNRVRFCLSPLIRPSVSSPSAFDLSAPSRGRVEVLRSGQPGMDAGLAAPGHGWPMAAGPRSRTGARAWRALASHRTKGARALGYLGLFQVTRCKSETNISRYRRNGYVHLNENGRLSGRHR
jgi:hypothetical protein